jgi:hypothetical protein
MGLGRTDDQLAVDLHRRLGEHDLPSNLHTIGDGWTELGVCSRGALGAVD